LIVNERQFTTMLIECLESFTPQEKAEANAKLYMHFGLLSDGSKEPPLTTEVIQ
jgi:hypothetical protein